MKGRARQLLPQGGARDMCNVASFFAIVGKNEIIVP